MSDTGVVVIGRNEGDRLRCCLESLRAMSSRTVYVDSGSTDGSVALSRNAGVSVVQLDPTKPFTAARARNEGWRRLLAEHPTATYVFFVDGDCEVAAGWTETAVRFLEQHPRVAVVWGFLRERYPDKSVYNLLCDMEWQQFPVGETNACGGNAVVRVAAFREVDGYRSDLICGEEPELCIRLRRAGWRVWRLGQPMALHDAGLDRFSQWWKRSLRGGYGYAQGAALYGASPERHWVTESQRAWVWGLWIPVTVFALMVVARWWALLVLLLYPLQILRLALGGKRSHRENWLRAGGLMLAKFPEMLGQLKFLRDRNRHVQSQLIEYK